MMIKNETPLAYECDRCHAVVARDDISWNHTTEEHLCPPCQKIFDAEEDELIPVNGRR